MKPIVPRPTYVFLWAPEFNGYVLMFDVVSAPLYVRDVPELQNSSLVRVQGLFRESSDATLDGSVGFLLTSRMPIRNFTTGLLCATNMWLSSSQTVVDTVLPVLRLKGRLVIFHSADNATLVSIPDISADLEESLTCI